MALMENIHVGTVSAGPAQTTYYDSDPSGAARETIVLLHGTGGSAENNFWALFPMLAMRHRVVAFDFLDPAEGEPAGEHYVEQALAVIAAASAGRPVHIVGYSFGAVIAALVATRHATALKSLTLVAGWLKTDTHQHLRNDIWRSLHASGHEALAPFTVLTSFSQSFINSKNPAELAALINGVRKGPDRSKKMEFNRAVDITEEVTRIGMPTLVVGCTHDQMVPIRHSRLLFGAIANSRFVEIASGHGIVHERPSELFAVIDRFIRDPEELPAGTVLTNAHA